MKEKRQVGKIMDMNRRDFVKHAGAGVLVGTAVAVGRTSVGVAVGAVVGAVVGSIVGANAS